MDRRIFFLFIISNLKIGKYTKRKRMLNNYYNRKKRVDKEFYPNTKRFHALSITKYNAIAQGSHGLIYSGILFLKGKNIKCIVKEHRISLKDDVKNFVSNVEKLVCFNHPNIVKTFGYVLKRVNQIYIAEIIMEHCKLETLQSILSSDIYIGKIQKLKYALEIASGLQYLHDNDFAHRDIKPSNILLGYDGRLKICDFNTITNSKNSNTLCGTLSYMDPLVIFSNYNGKMADIYSYGIVLWQILTREDPFPNITNDKCTCIYELISKTKLVPITPNIEKVKGFDMKIVYLIKQTWSNIKSLRPQSMKYIKNVLLENFNNETKHLKKIFSCENFKGKKKKISLNKTI